MAGAFSPARMPPCHEGLRAGGHFRVMDKL